MPEVKAFRDPADPLWEQLVNELKSGKQIEEKAITSSLLAANSLTQGNTASEFFPFRLIAENGCVIKEATTESATQAYLLNGVGTTGVLTSAGTAKFGEVLPGFVLINQPGQPVTGRTTKYGLYVQLWTAIAPASTITFGLYEVESFGETEKQIEAKVNLTALATAAFTTPAAKSAFNKTSAQATLTVTGNYVFGFTLSATTAAKSLVVARAQLFALNA